MSNSFEFLGCKYKICQFSGTVVGGESTVRTHTTIQNNRVYSNSVTYKDFFLIDGEGKEKHFSFTGSQLPPLRVGHIMQIMWVIKEGKNSGKYIAVRNATLGEYKILEDNVYEAYKGLVSRIIMTVAGISVLMMIIGIIKNATATSAPASTSAWLFPLIILISCSLINLKLSTDFQKIIKSEYTKRKLVI